MGMVVTMPDKFCSKCGATLATNSARCASCGFDPEASAGGPRPEPLSERVERLETELGKLKPAKQGIAAKVKAALRS